MELLTCMCFINGTHVIELLTPILNTGYTRHGMCVSSRCDKELCFSKEPKFENMFGVVVFIPPINNYRPQKRSLSLSMTLNVLRAKRPRVSGWKAFFSDNPWPSSALGWVITCGKLSDQGAAKIDDDERKKRSGNSSKMRSILPEKTPKKETDWSFIVLCVALLGAALIYHWLQATPVDSGSAASDNGIGFSDTWIVSQLGRHSD